MTMTEMILSLAEGFLLCTILILIERWNDL